VVDRVVDHMNSTKRHKRHLLPQTQLDKGEELWLPH